MGFVLDWLEKRFPELQKRDMKFWISTAVRIGIWFAYIMIALAFWSAAYQYQQAANLCNATSQHNIEIAYNLTRNLMIP